MSTYRAVAGMTGDLVFQLLEDDAPAEESLNGFQVALVLRDKYDRIVSGATVVNLDDGSAETRGVVQVNMGTTTLKADLSPYSARFVVTEPGTNKTHSWPTGDDDIWVVGRGA